MNLIREFRVNDPVKLSEFALGKSMGSPDMRGQVVDIQKTVVQTVEGKPEVVRNPQFVIVFWKNLTGSTYGYCPKYLEYAND